MRGKRSKQWARIALVFLVGCVFLLISFPLDRFMLGYANALSNPALDYIFGWFSYVLTVVFIMLIMTSLFMWEENRRHWIIPMWFSFALAGTVSFLLKLIVARQRPEAALSFLGFPDYSFPSSHTAVLFAVVPILDEEYPMLKWFWILFAVLVAASRIYLKAHFLSDVIAGALLGYAIGRTVLFLKERHGAFS